MKTGRTVPPRAAAAFNAGLSARRTSSGSRQRAGLFIAPLRNRFGQRPLATQYLRTFASQAEVEVARQSFVSDKPACLADGCVVGAFENRRPLVHFVEHRDVNHRRAGALRGDELRPE